MKWRRFFYAFLLRMIFAYVCVFAFYNTTGISLWHWPTESRFAFWMKITVGLALLASYFIMAWSTYGALKLKGILFSSIIIASIWITLVEFLAMLGHSRPELELILLSSIGTLFGIGINYSPIQYRLAGIGHTEVIQ
jgi:hypothetical protein